ncbi:MAG TPA: S8 family serine peptidase [Candidatus Dormibacteraeota bacterium]|nr:S8 family serine peptidase [Candidatus Dormibacteraeota bacterium]
MIAAAGGPTAAADAARGPRLAGALVLAIVASALATFGVRAADPSLPDPLLTRQWALTNIGAASAWCASTGAGVTVAVVDSGADFTHPDLRGKLVAGAQFLGDIPPNGPPSAGPGDAAAVTDTDGHGTMIAGIIAADTGNGTGIAGIAPDATILVVKVIGDQGTTTDADIANAIRWAVDHGALVVNVSLGPTDNLDTVDSDVPPAVEYAGSKDVNVTIAAGNAAFPRFNTYGPGDGALVVGALARDDRLASYSNSGGGIDVYAPGGDRPDGVTSTSLHGGYGSADGTSFAAPMAAGALALLRAKGESAASARARILATAVTRNRLPELDAAAALGASGQSCAMPRTAVSVAATAVPTVRPDAGAAPAPAARTGPAALPAAPSGGGHALLVAGLTGAAVAGGAGWVGFLAWHRERRRRRVLAMMKRAATIGRSTGDGDRRG